MSFELRFYYTIQVFLRITNYNYRRIVPEVKTNAKPATQRGISNHNTVRQKANPRKIKPEKATTPFDSQTPACVSWLHGANHSYHPAASPPQSHSQCGGSLLSDYVAIVIQDMTTGGRSELSDWLDSSGSGSYPVDLASLADLHALNGAMRP